MSQRPHVVTVHLLLAPLAVCVGFFQAAQPLASSALRRTRTPAAGSRTASGPAPSRRQRYNAARETRSSAVTSSMVSSGSPGVSGVCVRGGGGAGSGWRSRGRPVRGSRRWGLRPRPPAPSPALGRDRDGRALARGGQPWGSGQAAGRTPRASCAAGRAAAGRLALPEGKAAQGRARGGARRAPPPRPRLSPGWGEGGWPGTPACGAPRPAARSCRHPHPPLRPSRQSAWRGVGLSRSPPVPRAGAGPAPARPGGGGPRKRAARRASTTGARWHAPRRVRAAAAPASGRQPGSGAPACGQRVMLVRRTPS